MLRLGNLSPERFAELVGTEFSADEIAELHGVWSRKATLTGPEDFHIFDSPGISVTVGSRMSRVLDIFIAADTRKPFNREVQFDLDKDHETGTDA